MKYMVLLTGLLISAASANTTMEDLAGQYFSAWTASQAPNANTEDLEQYLALLKEDVAHQHLPYDADDERTPDGKQRMREGMTYYLGAHTEYQAKLIDQIIGKAVIVIVYEAQWTGVHPQTKAQSTRQSKIIEVLEIEDGMVAVIRKYNQ